MELSARDIFHYLTRGSIEPVAPTPGPKRSGRSLLVWNLVSLCFSLRRTQNNRMFNLLLLFPAPGFLWAGSRAGWSLFLPFVDDTAALAGVFGRTCRRIRMREAVFRLFIAVRDGGVGFLLLKGYHIS